MSGRARSEQELGTAFEVAAAEALGLVRVPGSGNRWYSKSDCSGAIRLSCKSSSKKRSWSQTRSQLSEAIDLAAGTGEVPALAVQDDDGEQFLILRLSDAATLLTEMAPGERKLKRSDRIRDAARLPTLLRD